MFALQAEPAPNVPGLLCIINKYLWRSLYKITAKEPKTIMTNIRLRSVSMCKYILWLIWTNDQRLQRSVRVLEVNDIIYGTSLCTYTYTYARTDRTHKHTQTPVRDLAVPVIVRSWFTPVNSGGVLEGVGRLANVGRTMQSWRRVICKWHNMFSTRIKTEKLHR